MLSFSANPRPGSSCSHDEALADQEADAEVKAEAEEAEEVSNNYPVP